MQLLPFMYCKLGCCAQHRLLISPNPWIEGQSKVHQWRRLPGSFDVTATHQACKFDAGESIITTLEFLQPIIKSSLFYGESIIQKLTRFVLLLVRTLIIIGPYFMDLLKSFRRV